eukprot:CAMPEP_0118814930 /NCGR_PEP_ID=MMETSP1162-20130426/3866_1 /TAXON_ID=33656 /ORGANISM="Phaeocystis Sp, Strain CCMP2710" /LENGTH=55 /DNA_ID=CAMNT_0006744853 /DNA_START=230 /DNA_END=397 /DNA_ORIENTATION=+
MIGSSASDCSDATKPPTAFPNIEPVMAFDATIAPVASASFRSTTVGGRMLAVPAI